MSVAEVAQRVDFRRGQVDVPQVSGQSVQRRMSGPLQGEQSRFSYHVFELDASVLIVRWLVGAERHWSMCWVRNGIRLEAVVRVR